MSYTHIKNDVEQNEALEQTLAMLEARTGTMFEQGLNPSVEILRPSLDHVNIAPRPLILYGLSNTVNWWLSSVSYPSYGMSQVNPHMNALKAVH